jgi:hypothetical protein
MVRSLIIDQFIFIITSFSPNDDHHRVSLDSFYIMCVVCCLSPAYCPLAVPGKKEHTTYIRNLFLFFFSWHEGETLKQVKKRIADFFSSKLFSYFSSLAAFKVLFVKEPKLPKL